MGGIEDKRREFLMKFSAEILSKACFEASFRPPILHRQNLRITAVLHHAPAPPAAPGSHPLGIDREGAGRWRFCLVGEGSLGQ